MEANEGEIRKGREEKGDDINERKEEKRGVRMKRRRNNEEWG